VKNKQTHQHTDQSQLKHQYRNPDILREADSILSDLPETLIDSYLATRYQIWIDSALVTLKIGCPSAPLAALMQMTSARNAVYVTACNPGSRIVPLDVNQLAMVRLYEKLAGCSNHIYQGAGIDPTGKWPAEESLLALDVDLPAARLIGKEFRQNAIVWIDSAAMPRLVLLH